jgi:CHASE2 domain-containing sensor protein
MRFRKKASELLRQLAKKKLWYWVKVGIIIVAGILAGHWLDEEGYLIGPRYKTYQLIQSMSPFPPYPQHTALVLIQDEEYWRGEPAGREPIKRDYVGKLVEALANADAGLIAVDFDLRSQMPDGSPAPERDEYAAEVRKFCEAVKNASQRRKVVLPKTIALAEYDGENYVYESKPDIHDGCDFAGGRVWYGYIALPPDTRQVPLLSLPVKNGPPLDSFSQAIVRASNEDVLKRLPVEEELPYGSFINFEEFGPRVVSAKELLEGNRAALDKVANKIVILSGAWHTQGYNTGSVTDSYETPVGFIPGSLIHANYVEAMLTSRVFRPWEGWTLVVIEVLLSLCVAIPFALEIRALKKFAIVASIGACVLAFGYFSLLNIGLFFDPFIPLILVAAHGVFEQIREWRADAHRYYKVAGGVNPEEV